MAIHNANIAMHNWIRVYIIELSIDNAIMDIHKLSRIMDIRNWIIDIHNNMNMDTYAAYTTLNIIQLQMPIWIMDIHNLVLNNHNSIMDSIHNWIMVIHWIHITVSKITYRAGSKAEKQRQSSKTIVYAGPKDQQLVLVIGNSHLPTYWSQPRFKIQNS